MIHFSELYIKTLFFRKFSFREIYLATASWPEPNVDFGSENAVDGLYTDRGQGGQCTISENKQTTAEWRVDLGSVVSISHIVIRYRTDNIPRRWCFKSF